MVETIAPGSSVTGINLPPVSRMPKPAVAAGFLTNRRRLTHSLRKRHGSEFVIDLPMFGRTVFVSDPALAKQLFRTSDEIVSNIDPNLGRVLGEGSIFNLEKRTHKDRRKLLAPPFHGKRMLTLRADHRRGVPGRGRHVAGRSGVPDSAFDHADHSQCDPARRVRR